MGEKENPWSIPEIRCKSFCQSVKGSSLPTSIDVTLNMIRYKQLDLYADDSLTVKL